MSSLSIAHFTPEDIPVEMKKAARWLLWRGEGRGEKVAKVPCTPDGRHCDHTDPANWMSFEEALTAYHGGGFDGLGFALGDGWSGVDLDGCVGPTGVPVQWAQGVLRLVDSYAEVSPSGRGIKIFCHGTAPNKRKGPVELYGNSRFFTVTGRAINKAPLREASGELKTLTDHLEDVLLAAEIEAGRRGEELQHLFTRVTGSYPSQSEADLAFCSLLVSRCGVRDEDRLDFIYRLSGLYRAKWDEPHASDGKTYGQMTVEKALGDQRGPSERSGKSPLLIVPGAVFIERARQNPPRWFVKDLIGTGLVTSLAGVQRQAGKSTLMADILSRLTGFGPPRGFITVEGCKQELAPAWCSFEIIGFPRAILLITEEPPPVWFERPPVGWDRVDVIEDFVAVAENWGELAAAISAGKWELVIIDSFDELLAAFGVEDENQSLEVTRVFRRLLSLARNTQAAWLVLDFLRKSAQNGDLTEIRGTGAKGGRADVILTLTTVEGNERQRVLRGWSRFKLPAVLQSGLVIELDSQGRYHEVGSKAAMKAEREQRALAEFVLEHVPEEGATLANIAEECGEKKSTVSSKLQRAAKLGLVEKVGRGTYKRVRFTNATGEG